MKLIRDNGSTIIDCIALVQKMAFDPRKVRDNPQTDPQALQQLTNDPKFQQFENHPAFQSKRRFPK